MKTCDKCSFFCLRGELDRLPENCPCRETEILDEIKEKYNEAENHMLAYNSSTLESEGYGVNTRLEEIMKFAKKCGYQKLGVAFCAGLGNEARILCKILRHNGFEVSSVACKNGSIPKEFLGISEEQKLKPGTYEAMCNPIGQAFFLNREKTDFNIIVGLCVGHDTLFMKYSEAPMTVFIAKDRVLAHNPAGALYCSEGYFKGRFYKD